jgi:hypothetical protein
VLNQKGKFECPNGAGSSKSTSKPTAKLATESLGSMADDKFSLVVANLKQRGHARHRKLKTLTSTIASRFPRGLPERELTAPGDRLRVARTNSDHLRNQPLCILINVSFCINNSVYRLNYIRAKRSDTCLAWVNSIFLVVNPLVLLRVIFKLCKKCLAIILWSLSTSAKSRHFNPRLRTVNIDDLCSQTARS